MANSIIPNQSYFSDFRQRCEDKNTLTKKGDLYVGTGNKITTKIDVNNPVDIYETDVLSAPAEAGQVIISKGGQNGIEYRDILVALNGVIDNTNKVSQSIVSDTVKISGYSAAEKSAIKIAVVSELPSPADPSTLYIIF
nr:MAG TPA: hypothetical protein [Caudoviricetes sp.]